MLKNTGLFLECGIQLPLSVYGEYFSIGSKVYLKGSVSSLWNPSHLQLFPGCYIDCLSYSFNKYQLSTCSVPGTAKHWGCASVEGDRLLPFWASGPVSRGQLMGCLVWREAARMKGWRVCSRADGPSGLLIPLILLPSYDPSLRTSLVFSNMGMKSGFIILAGNLKHAKWTLRALVGKVLRISGWHSRALTTHGPFCVPWGPRVSECMDHTHT